jgi:hypothetical protein
MMSGVFLLELSALHLNEILFAGCFLLLSWVWISLKVSSITSRKAENVLWPRRDASVFHLSSRMHLGIGSIAAMAPMQELDVIHNLPAFVAVVLPVAIDGMQENDGSYLDHPCSDIAY